MKDAVDYAVEVADYLGRDITCERFRHSEPCGLRRDPGPRDDTGRRWHWCFRVVVDGEQSFVGRRDNVLHYLEDMALQKTAAVET